MNRVSFFLLIFITCLFSQKINEPFRDEKVGKEYHIQPTLDETPGETSSTEPV